MLSDLVSLVVVVVVIVVIVVLVPRHGVSLCLCSMRRLIVREADDVYFPWAGQPPAMLLWRDTNRRCHTQASLLSIVECRVREGFRVLKSSGLSGYLEAERAVADAEREWKQHVAHTSAAKQADMASFAAQMSGLSFSGLDIGLTPGRDMYHEIQLKTRLQQAYEMRARALDHLEVEFWLRWQPHILVIYTLAPPDNVKQLQQRSQQRRRNYERKGKAGQGRGDSGYDAESKTRESPRRGRKARRRRTASDTMELEPRPPFKMLMECICPMEFYRILHETAQSQSLVAHKRQDVAQPPAADGNNAVSGHDAAPDAQGVSGNGGAQPRADPQNRDHRYDIGERTRVDRFWTFLDSIQFVDNVLAHLCHPPQLQASPPPTPSLLGLSGTPHGINGGPTSQPCSSAVAFYNVLCRMSMVELHRWFDVERIELIAAPLFDATSAGSNTSNADARFQQPSLAADALLQANGSSPLKQRRPTAHAWGSADDGSADTIRDVLAGVCAEWATARIGGDFYVRRIDDECDGGQSHLVQPMALVGCWHVSSALSVVDVAFFATNHILRGRLVADLRQRLAAGLKRLDARLCRRPLVRLLYPGSVLLPGWDHVEHTSTVPVAEPMTGETPSARSGQAALLADCIRHFDSSNAACLLAEDRRWLPHTKANRRAHERQTQAANDEENTGDKHDPASLAVTSTGVAGAIDQTTTDLKDMPLVPPAAAGDAASTATRDTRSTRPRTVLTQDKSAVSRPRRLRQTSSGVPRPVSVSRQDRMSASASALTPTIDVASGDTQSGRNSSSQSDLASGHVTGTQPTSGGSVRSGLPDSGAVTLPTVDEKHQHLPRRLRARAGIMSDRVPLSSAPTSAICCGGGAIPHATLRAMQWRTAWQWRFPTHRTASCFFELLLKSRCRAGFFPVRSMRGTRRKATSGGMGSAGQAIAVHVVKELPVWVDVSQVPKLLHSSSPPLSGAAGPVPVAARGVSAPSTVEDDDGATTCLSTLQCGVSAETIASVPSMVGNAAGTEGAGTLDAQSVCSARSDPAHLLHNMDQDHGHVSSLDLSQYTSTDPESDYTALKRLLGVAERTDRIVWVGGRATHTRNAAVARLGNVLPPVEPPLRALSSIDSGESILDPWATGSKGSASTTLQPPSRSISAPSQSGRSDDPEHVGPSTSALPQSEENFESAAATSAFVQQVLRLVTLDNGSYRVEVEMWIEPCEGAMHPTALTGRMDWLGSPLLQAALEQPTTTHEAFVLANAAMHVLDLRLASSVYSDALLTWASSFVFRRVPDADVHGAQLGSSLSLRVDERAGSIVLSPPETLSTEAAVPLAKASVAFSMDTTPCSDIPLASDRASQGPAADRSTTSGAAFMQTLQSLFDLVGVPATSASAGAVVPHPRSKAPSRLAKAGLQGSHPASLLAANGTLNAPHRSLGELLMAPSVLTGPGAVSGGPRLRVMGVVPFGLSLFQTARLLIFRHARIIVPSLDVQTPPAPAQSSSEPTAANAPRPKHPGKSASTSPFGESSARSGSAATRQGFVTSRIASSLKIDTGFSGLSATSSSSPEGTTEPTHPSQTASEAASSAAPAPSVLWQLTDRLGTMLRAIADFEIEPASAAAHALANLLRVDILRSAGTAKSTAAAADVTDEPGQGTPLRTAQQDAADLERPSTRLFVAKCEDDSVLVLAVSAVDAVGSSDAFVHLFAFLYTESRISFENVPSAQRRLATDGLIDLATGEGRSALAYADIPMEHFLRHAVARGPPSDQDPFLDIMRPVTRTPRAKVIVSLIEWLMHHQAMEMVYSALTRRHAALQQVTDLKSPRSSPQPSPRTNSADRLSRWSAAALACTSDTTLEIDLTAVHAAATVATRHARQFDENQCCAKDRQVWGTVAVDHVLDRLDVALSHAMASSFTPVASNQGLHCFLPSDEPSQADEARPLVGHTPWAASRSPDLKKPSMRQLSVPSFPATPIVLGGAGPIPGVCEVYASSGCTQSATSVDKIGRQAIDLLRFNHDVLLAGNVTSTRQPDVSDAVGNLHSAAVSGAMLPGLVCEVVSGRHSVLQRPTPTPSARLAEWLHDGLMQYRFHPISVEALDKFDHGRTAGRSKVQKPTARQGMLQSRAGKRKRQVSLPIAIHVLAQQTALTSTTLPESRRQTAGTGSAARSRSASSTRGNGRQTAEGPTSEFVVGTTTQEGLATWEHLQPWYARWLNLIDDLRAHPHTKVSCQRAERRVVRQFKPSLRCRDSGLIHHSTHHGRSSDLGSGTLLGVEALQRAWSWASMPGALRPALTAEQAQSSSASASAFPAPEVPAIQGWFATKRHVLPGPRSMMRQAISQLERMPATSPLFCRVELSDQRTRTRTEVPQWTGPEQRLVMDSKADAATDSSLLCMRSASSSGRIGIASALQAMIASEPGADDNVDGGPGMVGPWQSDLSGLGGSVSSASIRLVMMTPSELTASCNAVVASDEAYRSLPKYRNDYRFALRSQLSVRRYRLGRQVHGEQQTGPAPSLPAGPITQSQFCQLQSTLRRMRAAIASATLELLTWVPLNNFEVRTCHCNRHRLTQFLFPASFMSVVLRSLLCFAILV